MLLNTASKKVAYGGICVALSLLFLIIASVFPFCRLVFVFAASAIVGLSILSYDVKYAFAEFVAVAILSVIFVPNKPIAVLYALVVGNYPIVKFYVDRIKRKAVCYGVKAVIYNLYMFLAYKVAAGILGISFDLAYPFEVLWIGMLAVFFVYDYVYTVFMHKAFMFVLKK